MKSRRAEGLMFEKSVVVPQSFHVGYGVKVRRVGLGSDSSSSLEWGLKLRVPSPIIFLWRKSEMDLFKLSDYVRNRDFAKAYKWIIFMILSVT
ncbi:hypothetical protein TNCV_1140761 [Trichonephila clavipes]|nr:hypothetical protein TNCV_1140761 [Trichonephila clavipes]